MARIEATRLGLDIRFVVTDTECGSAEWIYKIRSTEQIKILKSLAPDHIALPFTLALYTGQRQGDLLRLQWRQYDGERIMLRQGQTGRHVSVKLAAPVKAMLERTRAALPALPGTTITSCLRLGVETLGRTAFSATAGPR